jgi:hypothetical protein
VAAQHIADIEVVIQVLEAVPDTEVDNSQHHLTG